MGLSVGNIVRACGRILPAAVLDRLNEPAALFFHGVEPRTDDARVQTNHHEAKIFARIAAALKRDFDVLPLTAIDDVLAHPRAHRRSLFLMSDDGYENTLTVAAEILAERALPWTLFVSTRHIDAVTRNPVFLARLFFYYAEPGIYAVPHFAQAIRLSDEKSRESAASAGITHLRFLPAPAAEQALAAMCAHLGRDSIDALTTRFGSEKFLGWDGVRALKARGVEIGAHADTHWPMHDGQSDDYLAQQACHARDRIEAEIGPCRFFAYPFGNTQDLGHRAWTAVRAAGFSHAFTTLSGTLAGGGNPFLLPRYGIGPRDTDLGSVIPLLRAGNPRLAAWQKRLR